MCNYIVLVKQVPDVSRIDEDAFDPVTGTLLRNKLTCQINDLDSQALAFAYKMRELSGDSGKIVALTMGPESAVDVLRYCLSRGADDAVHVCDPLLAGADTWATARTLALAIEKIVTEKFAGSPDYYIVSGMQSVDGDTAQVPAQISSHLGIPIVPYATATVTESDKLAFKVITCMGSEIVRPVSRPALVTVAKCEFPLFPVFGLSRLANKFAITKYTGADFDTSDLGVKGSKTRVVKIFQADEENRKRIKINTVSELADCVLDSLSESNEQMTEVASGEDYTYPEHRSSCFDKSYEADEKIKAKYDMLNVEISKWGIQSFEGIDENVKNQIWQNVENDITGCEFESLIKAYQTTEPSYNGPVWVVGEIQDDKVIESTIELIGEGRLLADQVDAKLCVLLIGENAKQCADSLSEYPVDEIYYYDNIKFNHFDPMLFAQIVEGGILEYKPQIVLYSATPQGRVLAPIVAYKLDCGLTADCTSFRIADNSLKGNVGILYQTRPALGGNVMATILTKKSMSQMSTVRPGVFSAPPKIKRNDAANSNPIKIAFNIENVTQSLMLLSAENIKQGETLDTDVVISGGKGMHSRDKYNDLLKALSQSISNSINVECSIGASRAAVENGFASRARQVGQTGTTVKPKLYVAIGISGAIQHMIGVGRAGKIIAINSDPAAPIFKKCDYYYVGKAQDVVPELCKAIQAKKVN